MNRTGKRRIGSLAALGVSVVAANGAAFAQSDGKRTVIEGSYFFVADRLRPEPAPSVRTRQAFRVVLSGLNSIDETWRNQTVSGRTVRQGQRMRVLGGDGDLGASWRVGGRNQLVRINNAPQSQSIVTITIGRGSDCRMSVVFRLKPGFSEFRFRRQVDRTWGYFANVRVEGATCSIVSE